MITTILNKSGMIRASLLLNFNILLRIKLEIYPVLMFYHDLRSIYRQRSSGGLGGERYLWNETVPQCLFVKTVSFRNKDILLKQKRQTTRRRGGEAWLIYAPPLLLPSLSQLIQGLVNFAPTGLKKNNHRPYALSVITHHPWTTALERTTWPGLLFSRGDTV